MPADKRTLCMLSRPAAKKRCKIRFRWMFRVVPAENSFVFGEKHTKGYRRMYFAAPSLVYLYYILHYLSVIIA